MVPTISWTQNPIQSRQYKFWSHPIQESAIQYKIHLLLLSHNCIYLLVYWFLTLSNQQLILQYLIYHTKFKSVILKNSDSLLTRPYGLVQSLGTRRSGPDRIRPHDYNEITYNYTKSKRQSNIRFEYKMYLIV